MSNVINATTAVSFFFPFLIWKCEVVYRERLLATPAGGIKVYSENTRSNGKLENWPFAQSVFFGDCAYFTMLRFFSGSEGSHQKVKLIQIL